MLLARLSSAAFAQSRGRRPFGSRYGLLLWACLFGAATVQYLMGQGSVGREERLWSRILVVQLLPSYLMRQACVGGKQGFFSRVCLDGEYFLPGATSVTYSGAAK